MNTNLERVAAKAQREMSLKFTSLAHHITKELIGESLARMSKYTASGIDHATVGEALKDFNLWIDDLLESIHRESYKLPAVRRVWIPKPGKAEKRPIGIPTVIDRALQRSTTVVLSAIYEQDFLNCSFGGRPGRGAHNALATLNEIIAGKKVSWVFEADLKNFFGSLDHQWMLKFVKHRVGDPRIICMVKRWLKAGVMENGEIQASEVGTPQGGLCKALHNPPYAK